MPSVMKYVTIGANRTGAGNQAWADPEKIAATGEAYFSASQLQQYSNYLAASAFGFAIPADDIIDGIVVEHLARSNGVNQHSDSEIKLILANNTIGGTNHQGGTYWPTTAAWRAVGSSTDKWGLALKGADVNDPDFGCVLSAYTGNGGTGYVDSVRITVYHSPPPIPSAPTVTSPNGGETIDASHNVTWTAATDPDTPQANLQYHIQHNANGGTWTDVIALTAAGATSYLWDTSALPAGTAYKIRIRAFDGTYYGPFDESNAAFTISHNVAPNAPILNGKDPFDATGSSQFTWTSSDPDAGDYQSAYQMLVKRASDGAIVFDSGKVAAGTSAHTLAANTLANGVQYQWQVRTWDRYDVVGPYSALSAFETSAKPSVTITDPAADGAVVATPEYTLRWSFSDPESGGQSAYQVVRKEGATTVSDTGKVASTVAREFILSGLVNGASYSVEVAVWDNKNVKSSVSVRTFTVSYTPPAIPLLTVTSDADNGRNVVTWDNPTPSGTEPAILSNDLFRRKVGEADWVRIATGLAVDGVYHDYSPAGGETYEYRLRALGDNGTHTDSGVNQAVLVLSGVWVHDPDDPVGTIQHFIYDGMGSGETNEQQVELLRFAGREKPVPRFGDSISFGVTQTLQLPNDLNDRQRLKSLFVKKVLCYRDTFGRKLFGVLASLPVTDDLTLSSAEISLTATDHSEAV